jgi:hypothetical protein
MMELIFKCLKKQTKKLVEKKEQVREDMPNNQNPDTVRGNTDSYVKHQNHLQ